MAWLFSCTVIFKDSDIVYEKTRTDVQAGYWDCCGMYFEAGLVFDACVGDGAGLGPFIAAGHFVEEGVGP